MRVHRLEITAFGPFSGTQQIDFDTLTDAGLFLLCGPTGAGKTSVLDAVCFGLYGEVPGDRNSAKRLRSDHAPSGVAPCVVLEISVNGRRFRIRRSPAWQRPKRRGTGMTTEQARVSLEESLDGTWLHLSSRLDEVGQQVTDLLGMNLTQFCQVAMLPQGRFQSFLRAKSDERHKVLQQLFRTSRFEDIERWLVAHRQSLKSANRQHEEAVSAVVSRLSEVSSEEAPDQWQVDKVADGGETDGLAGWAARLSAVSREAHAEMLRELRVSSTELHGAREALEEARRTAELRARHQEALLVCEALERSHQTAVDARRRLEAARRAAVVAPLLHVAEAAHAAADTARRSLADLLADAAGRLGAEPVGLTQNDLATAERNAREAATIAKALLPREAELQAAQKAVDEAIEALEALAGRETELRERRGTIPPRLESLRTALTQHSSLAARIDAVQQLEEQLTGQLDAARRLATLQVEVDSARRELQLSVDTAQELRERMHGIREARINGMAAELAAALASGDSCPVCGSADHPSVARPIDGAPSHGDEEAARAAYENADFTRQTHAELVSNLERNCALAAQAAGGKTVDALEVEIEQVRTDRAACRTAMAEAERLRVEIAALEEELASLQERSVELGAESVRLKQERIHAETLIEKSTAELAALFDQAGVADSVERLIEMNSTAGQVFGAAREALASSDAATARSREANRQALECAVQNGFESTDSASAAMLTAAEVHQLEDDLREREAQRSRAEGVLQDARVAEAAAGEEPDLAGLSADFAVLEEAHASCVGRVHQAAQRVARVEELEAELSGELATWAPTRSAYAVALTLSTFAEGKGGDNSLQMRLSAYVLASRLGQVVASANERLKAMSDGRYALEHSASRGAGELRGGLSLLVRDEWTGESRDPATLSGGETFVVSLALALGLADVVTQEAGGSNIDTLFIDEGFGTLDAETLDDVMNTLDGLRDGGRVVGIVSHVPEMRTRITSQLQIRKDRSGSRILATRETL